MSQEREHKSAVGDMMKYIAIAFLGVVSTMYSTNTSPGLWAEKQKRKLKAKR
jgi:hypothetical protein